jgi:glutamyl-tRNA reductase
LTALASDRPTLDVPVGRTESTQTPLAPFLAYGFSSSLGSIPLEELERRARRVTRDQVRTWFARFLGTEEVAVLSTCHRVELILLVRSEAEAYRWLEVLPGPPRTWQVWEGSALLHHLFRVAAGRESLALGEAEVRLQVRAVQRSVVSRHPRPVLARLFSAAASAAEEAVPFGTPLPSVARVAATVLSEQIDHPLPRVLVVGAGAVGRQVAESLARSARVTVVYRARSPKPEFVEATGVRTVRFDSLADELPQTDAVITAIKSGSPCLRASDLPRDRPLVLVDLGMPRNIDPEVRTLPNVRLVDLEELHGRFGSAASNPEQDAHVARRAEAYLEAFRGELWEPWVSAWLRSAEEVRRRELASARRFLGSLTPEQEAAVDRLTHRLLTRLLIPPAQRMRSLPTGPDGAHDRELVLRLLGPDVDDPR